MPHLQSARAGTSTAFWQLLFNYKGSIWGSHLSQRGALLRWRQPLHPHPGTQLPSLYPPKAGQCQRGPRLWRRAAKMWLLTLLSCEWYLTVDTCGNPDPHLNAEKTAKLSSGWHPHKAGGKACFQDLHTDESLVCILHVWHCSKTFLGYWPANLFRLISSFALIFNYYFC